MGQQVRSTGVSGHRHFPVAERFIGMPIEAHALKVGEEAHEVQLATEDLHRHLSGDNAADHTRKLTHLAEELWDTIHSAETALTRLERHHGVPVDTVRTIVEAKNLNRGYYEAVPS